MTRLAHLSDLHFGFHRRELVNPLLDRLNAARPDLVVVTGDLTHRARPGQYAQAAAFLSRIEAPVMAIPGNHDIPLHNLPLRLLLPWHRFRRNIDGNLTPSRRMDPVRVMSLNSVDPFAVQRGVIRRGELAALEASLVPGATNIVALHHPLEHLAQVDKNLATRAPQALARLARAGVQIVLSGHLHVWGTGAMLEQTAHPGLLQVQAGTALCARVTDRQNEFSVLHLDGPSLMIERHIAPMGQTDFQPPEREYFSRQHGIWTAHQAAEIPVMPHPEEGILGNG